jgi:hypothetical protein
VNAQSGGYGNAFQTASYMGNEKIIKVLLNKGTNKNLE